LALNSFRGVEVGVERGEQAFEFIKHKGGDFGAHRHRGAKRCLRKAFVLPRQVFHDVVGVHTEILGGAFESRASVVIMRRDRANSIRIRDVPILYEVVGRHAAQSSIASPRLPGRSWRLDL
jgi:hypothetical protein